MDAFRAMGMIPCRSPERDADVLLQLAALGIGFARQAATTPASTTEVH